MPAPVLQFKRGILSNLPGLRAGEPGFTTDSYELYVGINSTTQENKFFGSHRYWTRQTATTGSGVNLVEGSNNGSEYITLASPASVGAAVTYTFPASPIASNVLTTDANGVLSWTTSLTALNVENLIIGIGTFTNDVGFTTTTNNTLGDENTGAVQLDGGMGIAKNLTVKQNLHVGGYAEFVGVVTFKGGTINIGDNNTDDINVGGEFISGLVPNVDDTHDLGITTQRWRTLNVVNILTTNLTGTAGTITTFNSTNGTVTNLTSTNVSVSGVSTLGIATATQLYVAGVTTTGNLTVNGTAFFAAGLAANSSSFFENILATGDLDVDGYTELDDVNVSGTLNVVGVSTFTGAIDANGGADISGGETTLSSATVSDLTAGRVVLAGTSGALEDSANLTFSGAGLIVGAGGINVTGVSTFSTDLVVGGDIRVNGNDIKASDGATNITLTSSTLTTFAGDIKVTGNDIQSSSATAITLSGADVEVIGDLKVTGNDIKASDGNTNITLTSNTLTTFAGDIKVGGNDIQASDGTVAITLAGNDVTVADDLTVSGNLYVNGSTTQVNTAALTVEDRTIDLGIVNGAAPTGNTTWDLGILFNYYATNAAKKSAVIWEHADARFKFASVLAADTDGNSTSTPQLTVTTFAPIEIASLFVNDCAGASQVISCTGTERFLENITVDAGSF
jgi:trimeric autotransporter adhesin